MTRTELAQLMGLQLSRKEEASHGDIIYYFVFYSHEFCVSFYNSTSTERDDEAWACATDDFFDTMSEAMNRSAGGF